MIAMSSGCWLMASRTCVRAQSRCRESKCVSQTSCAFVWLGLAGRRLSAEAIQRGAHRAFAMTHFPAHAILLVDDQRVVDAAGLVRRFAHAQHQSQSWRQRTGSVAQYGTAARRPSRPVTRKRVVGGTWVYVTV